MNLFSPIYEIPRVNQTTVQRLKKIGLKKIIDLIYHFPFRYDDWSKILTILEFKKIGSGTVRAKIKQIANRRTPRKKMILTEALISDDTDSLKVVWFGQPFLINVLKPNQIIFFAGKVEYDENFGLQLISPSYEFPKKEGLIHLGRLVPIYPSTEKLSQKQIRFLIKEVVTFAQKVEDFLPQEIKKDYQLMNLSLALEQIHFPASKNLLTLAQHRLKFDELFLIQLQTKIIREKLKKQKASKIEIKLEEIKKFVKILPFELTKAQKKSAWEILKDLEKSTPMNRLLEGDVGSGKTVVATIAILNVVLNGYQVAYLAPTEILAHQHFENIGHLLKDWPFKIALLTREETEIKIKEKRKKIKKAELLEKIKEGKISLTIGTHAILQEGVVFKNLGLIIVDEQHRFGVQQRAQLVQRRSTQIKTQIDADDKTQIDADDGFLYKGLSYQIRGAIFEVFNNLGPGLKEVIYQKALEEEFKKRKINFETEKSIEIYYKDKKISIYKPDFIVENKIILEIKALPFISRAEKKQIWNYLKSSDYKVALLVNFGFRNLNIERIIYDKARKNLQKSARNLRESASIPHFLSMTATPIPRSLALTLYGDLDLSIIDEMPVGRKKVEIKIVAQKEKEKVYEFIRKEIKNGRQAFVICPLIDADKRGFKTQINADQEADKYRYLRESAVNLRKSALMDMKSVKQEFEKLNKEIFPDLKLAMLHGKLKSKEKEKIMSAFAGGYGGSSEASREGGKDFRKKRTDILISTTVVEVGIDVPNASIMLIEGAERFGLAQLWQLKGRVGRAQYQSYCFLFSESYSEKARKRLSALLMAKNGFELAEKDLEMRGPGEIFGSEQSGYLEILKIARLTDTEIIKETQEATQKILSLDPELKNFPLLQEKIKEITKITHLE